MILAWIGIGVGVLIILILIVKLLKTTNSAIKFEQHCQKCGEKNNGLQCPKCDGKPFFGV